MGSDDGVIRKLGSDKAFPASRKSRLRRPVNSCTSATFLLYQESGTIDPSIPRRGRPGCSAQRPAPEVLNGWSGRCGRGNSRRSGDPQQTPLQGKTAGGNAHGARPQALTGEQPLPAGGDAQRRRQCACRAFPLASGEPPGGAEEQGAAQLRPSRLITGHIGLVVVERPRPGKALYLAA